MIEDILMDISTRLDGLIVFWPKDKPIRCFLCVASERLICKRAPLCAFFHFNISCGFYPTGWRCKGSAIHLFGGLHAFVIALVQCWFFIRHLFPKSPGSFSFIRPTLERQYKALCHRVPEDTTSFQCEHGEKGQEPNPGRESEQECCRLLLCLELNCL